MRQTNRYCIFDFFGDSYDGYDILRGLGMKVVDDYALEYEMLKDTPYVYDSFGNKRQTNLRDLEELIDTYDVYDEHGDLATVNLRDVYDVIELFGEKAAVYSCEEIDWDNFDCEKLITYDNYSFE